jgi:cyanate permease
MAEFPGLLLAALLIDRIGRKVTLGGMILLCCAFLAPLATQLREDLSIILLFCARSCIMGCMAVLHVYSPEVIVKHTPLTSAYSCFHISLHLVCSPDYMIYTALSPTYLNCKPSFKLLIYDAWCWMSFHNHLCYMNNEADLSLTIM